MTTMSLNGDFKFIRSGHHRSGIDPYHSRRQGRPVVQRVNRITGKPLKQSVVDHGFRATQSFFGRLKDQNGSAIEISVLHQIFSSPEQDRRMTIMATRMHHPWHLRAILRRAILTHRQGIHICAQTDHLP